VLLLAKKIARIVSTLLKYVITSMGEGILIYPFKLSSKEEK
jgi:hypothetical protein